MNCKNKSFMTKKKAFTLIELLIVIAIIGILFIVLISKVDFATDKAKASGVQTDFRSFQMAFDTVAREQSGFSGLVDDNYDKLEAAINKNLDAKLHIDIDDATGEITMLNGALDPWKVPYHGAYVTGTDGKDRGAMIMYSNGANRTFGSEATIAGGIVTITTTNDDGKDDYAIVSCYSLKNSYGEVTNTTVGFSNNQVDNTGVDLPENNDGNNGNDSFDEIELEPVLNSYGFYEYTLYDMGSEYMYYRYLMFTPNGNGDYDVVLFIDDEDGIIQSSFWDVVSVNSESRVMNGRYQYTYSEDGKTIVLFESTYTLRDDLVVSLDSFVNTELSVYNHPELKAVLTGESIWDATINVFATLEYSFTDYQHSVREGDEYGYFTINYWNQNESASYIIYEPYDTFAVGKTYVLECGCELVVYEDKIVVTIDHEFVLDPYGPFCLDVVGTVSGETYIDCYHIGISSTQMMVYVCPFDNQVIVGEHGE